ncbi:protein MpBHLH34 [Marchantia polymorpha subsp. ruderalis]
MAELAWLTSSPAAKVTLNASSSFSNSNENLFDLLQGRLGSGAFGGAATVDSSSFFRTSDQMTNVTVASNHTESTVSLMKAEDGNNHMHSPLWVAAGAAAVATDGIYSSTGPAAAHVPSIDSTQLSSYVKPHDPSPQLQALRDFMAYGSNVNNHSMSTAVDNINLAPGNPMFLHLGEESPASLLIGMPHHSNPISTSPSKGPDMMAYRALCQAELFATERSPHRTQFQRENHILAERQRREEMNEKFSALRAMIPKATKKDKASIVGDTIAYVLELEKTLKQLKACKDSRKGFSFKLLKKKSSSKVLEDNDRSTSDTAPDTAAPEEMKPGPGCSNSTRFEDIVLKECKEREEPTISSSDNISRDCSHNHHKPMEKDNLLDIDISSSSQVEVQNLGEQAVIKIVCARSRGLVLRIIQALEECKTEILQSNVTTVSQHSVHFITVQINSGLSCSIEQMVQALLKASNPNQIAET